MESLKPEGTKILITNIPLLSFPNLKSFLKTNQALGGLLRKSSAPWEEAALHVLTGAHRKKSEQDLLIPCTRRHRHVSQSCPPCLPCARVVSTTDTMACTTLPFLGDAALHLVPVFFWT